MDDERRPRVQAEHVAHTRARIVDAVVRLVAERNDVDFTMPDVARASGVSLRTVYRYFPTRQSVVDAVAAVGDRVAASNLPAAAFELDDLEPWLREAWQHLLEREAFIRAQHASPNGADVRRARIPYFREVTRALLEREVPGVSPETRDDIVDTVLLLVSSSSMFEMLDVLEVPIERAARLVSVAVRALVDANRTT